MSSLVVIFLLDEEGEPVAFTISGGVVGLVIVDLPLGPIGQSRDSV